MGETAWTTIVEIDRLVAGQMRDVPRQRTFGEFIAAPHLKDSLTRQGGSDPIWIGKVLQVDADSTILRERDLVAAPKRLSVINRYALSQFGENLTQLSGRQLELEVEPFLARDGVLKLNLWRLLSVRGTGCWTQAKDLERGKLKGVRRRGEADESPVELAQLPPRITVLAPKQGSASRSDVRGILKSPLIPDGVQIEWAKRMTFTGRQAPLKIAEAVRDADRHGGIILLMRGGGGRGDFWPFETAVVGRAIQESSSRVITALGHGENRTLADDVADHSFAVPRAAADEIAAACNRVVKGRRRKWSPTKDRRPEPSRIVELEEQIEAVSASLATVKGERASLQEKLAVAESDRKAALADRDRVQAELGGAMLRTLEPGAGLDAVMRMRDAVHARYFSALPVLLAFLFAYACVTGAEGADRIVWGGCALLYAGAAATCWAGARHLAQRARTLIKAGL